MNKNYLCHYTKAETAFKILKSSTLWASDHRFLDDASEVVFLSEQLSKLIINTNRNIFLSQINSIMSHYRFYLTSFTQHKTLDTGKYGNLAMGRYFGGEDWIGLVFDDEKINSCFSKRQEEICNEHEIAYINGNVVYFDPDDSSNYQKNFAGFSDLIICVLQGFLNGNYEKNFNDNFSYTK